jgi:ribosome-associated protein
VTVTPRPRKIQLPYSELEFSFVRSSGPGGQNVNKVNSKAVLRWDFQATSAFAPDDHARMLRKLGPRLTIEGELIVTSDRFRDQKMNKEDCLDKLLAILTESMIVPKARRKTKPTQGSKRRKLESKSRDGAKKKLRGKVEF